MYTSKNPKWRYLIVGLLIMTMTGVAEARQDEHSNSRHYRQDHGHDHHRRSYRDYQPIGHRVSLLPAAYLALTFAGLNYYYNSGAYYQRAGDEYVVVRPPSGIAISVLPAGYRSIYRGRHRYYTANDVFYRWDDFHRNYVVVDAPTSVVATTSTLANVPEQYVYPNQGQNRNQTSRDRYECYLWAVDQTGVEPAQVNGANSINDMENYQRANGACLQARGYSVK